MRMLSLLALVGFMLSLPGCGQKGPLVLPDEQHPHKKVGLPKSPPPPTPATPAAPGTPTPPAGPNSSTPSPLR